MILPGYRFTGWFLRPHMLMISPFGSLTLKLGETEGCAECAYLCYRWPSRSGSVKGTIPVVALANSFDGLTVLGHAFHAAVEEQTSVCRLLGTMISPAGLQAVLQIPRIGYPFKGSFVIGIVADVIQYSREFGHLSFEILCGQLIGAHARVSP